jgi:hypothetical protein
MPVNGETGGKGSGLEGKLVAALAAAGLPAPVPQFRPFPPGGRRWKFDLAWPAARLLVEVDGGTYSQGAHTRGARIDQDAEKRATAVAAGWRVMVITKYLITGGGPAQLTPGLAATLIAEALACHVPA